MPWSIALCRCNETLAWDADPLRLALGLPEPPLLFDRLPRDEIHRLIDRLGRGGVDRLLIGCCGRADYFREVAGAAGVDPANVTVINFKESCFWPHVGPTGDRARANDKAARLMRSAMRLAERGGAPPDVSVKAGPTVLIATDSPAGLALAKRLGEVGRPILLLDERSAAFDPEFIHPLPWKTNWGTLGKIEGTLGSFTASIERTQPLDLETCIACQRCVPVCHTSAISQGLRLRMELCDQCGDCLKACEHVGAIKIPRSDRERLRADQVVILTANGAPALPPRTGLHVLSAPTPGDVDALAWKIFGLIGEFRKPRYVEYDPETCAGGAAGHEACGRCITSCPYQAIARNPRNPLRVQVDPQACEGCGACVSACPTSSLTFTDPRPAELGERLAALLAPLAGSSREPLVVAFHCPEKGAAALAAAGRLRQAYPASVLPVPMACLRHVSEANILTALRFGAGGVALLGCESCPHGERELLLEKLDIAGRVLDAFGLGRERVHLITGSGAEMVEALDTFARSVTASPLAWDGQDGAGAGNREAFRAAIRSLIDATGREPGRVAMPATAPFAFPDVRVQGCTLCRTCVNVCPTHAFRYQEDRQTLELRQVDCVNCGLCASACPESVITLKPEIFLDRGALEYQVVAQDETLRCAKCDAPFGTRRAVEVIEAKVFGMANLLDTFTGARRNLLRMCPNCRAVAATLEMQKGWEP